MAHIICSLLTNSQECSDGAKCGGGGGRMSKCNRNLNEADTGPCNYSGV